MNSVHSHSGFVFCFFLSVQAHKEEKQCKSIGTRISGAKITLNINLIFAFFSMTFDEIFFYQYFFLE